MCLCVLIAFGFVNIVGSNLHVYVLVSILSLPNYQVIYFPFKLLHEYGLLVGKINFDLCIRKTGYSHFYHICKLCSQ